MLYCFVFSLIIFFFGLFGILLMRVHTFIGFISLELMFLGVSLNFIFSSYFSDDIVGLIFGLVIFVVAAVESVMGLSILVFYYRFVGNISIDFSIMLKA